jgi:hypothetical protein
MSEYIHLHKNQDNSSSQLILLLIPPLVFILIVAIYLLGIKEFKSSQLATSSDSESSVLGEETNLTQSD